MKSKANIFLHFVYLMIENSEMFIKQNDVELAHRSISTARFYMNCVKKYSMPIFSGNVK